MWRNKDVFCWYICGPQIWCLAVWGSFIYTRLFFRKIWAHICSEQIQETGNAPLPLHHFLSLIPNLIGAHPLLFVCSISFNIFTATVHAVVCAMSLKFRMTLWHFQVMFLAIGNRQDGQTLYSICLQHAAHSHVGKLCTYYKNTQ